jgi:hypothetical protein
MSLLLISSTGTVEVGENRFEEEASVGRILNLAVLEPKLGLEAEDVL